MVLLQETKLNKCDNYLISRLWPFDEVDWLFSPTDGASGGLCCIAGDFNTVRNVYEIRGCVYEGVRIQDFNNFINEGELVDLLLLGSKFTWFNSGSKMSRIDRFLVDMGWVLKF
ncbi:hypothetical protein REPUB_Repub07fG0215400 [Reevesia pubescens]